MKGFQSRRNTALNTPSLVLIAERKKNLSSEWRMEHWFVVVVSSKIYSICFHSRSVATTHKVTGSGWSNFVHFLLPRKPRWMRKLIARRRGFFTILLPNGSQIMEKMIWHNSRQIDLCIKVVIYTILNVLHLTLCPHNFLCFSYNLQIICWFLFFFFYFLLHDKFHGNVNFYKLCFQNVALRNSLVEEFSNLINQAWSAASNLD